MCSRIYRAIVLFGVCACLVLVEESQAKTTLRLQAGEQTQIWQSPNRLTDHHALAFTIWVDGREIGKRGHFESNCRYTLFSRRLALELANCGRSKVTIRYVGSARFTFVYWVKR